MFQDQINQVKVGIQEQSARNKALKKLDLFVLDNSLRETTVGQLRGHTIEDKWKIYDEVKRVGFKHIIVASFSHMTRLGDTFIRQLREKGEDMSLMYAFTEFLEKVVNRVPDTEVIPIGLLKMKELGIKNVIIEMDLVYNGIDYTKFNAKSMCQLFSKRFQWIRENLASDARILINLRDLPDAMMRKPRRVFKIVNYLSSLPAEERPFGLVFEESGKYFPEQLGVWTKAIRKEMDRCGFQSGQLLVHVHQQWGMHVIAQLECLANGANGIWAGLCEEGAMLGHACSTLTMMNLVRMGNKRILKKYNCTELRRAAQAVTKITTGVNPPLKQPVYGARALDVVFGMDQFTPDKKDFSMVDFFGEKPVMRMTTLASPKMIVTRLKNVFGENAQFTEEMAKKMLALMLEDLHKNRKEEYMSEAGLALLFDRAGGKITAEMGEKVAAAKSVSVHIDELIAEIRAMWDEWDLRDGEKDDALEFDAFYNGFMAPYFGCYRCDETKKALKAIDMDSDGTVDWNEFAVYLKWAGRQYPATKDAEELLSVAFRKGLIPAMQDEVIKQSDHLPMITDDDFDDDHEIDYYRGFESDEDEEFCCE
eukprot:gene11795-13015_t